LKPLEFSPERPSPVIIGLADGNREHTNSGKRFVYGTEYGWDVSYLGTYVLQCNIQQPGNQNSIYSILPKQDAMITPDWDTHLATGGYRSSFFDISTETGEGIVVGCRQYLAGARTWDMFECTIDESVLDENYWQGTTAYILRTEDLCSFDFVPDDDQFEGVGYPNSPTNARRGNTAGGLIQNSTTTKAYILAGTCCEEIGGVGQIPDNTPGGIFIASRGFTNTIHDVESDGFSANSNADISIAGISPNPTSGKTVFQLHSQTASTASLRIFDSAGRLVDILPIETMTIGDNLFEWNLTDSAHPLCNGIYFAVLRANGETVLSRFAVLR